MKTILISIRSTRESDGNKGISSITISLSIKYIFLANHVLPTLYFLVKLFSPYSTHPYIFFNQDRVSITFVGFTVTRQGDLIDPATQRVLEKAIMTPQLYEGLKHNRVNFQDNYRNWGKAVMIEKISTVMGVDFPYDPDESYVLTVDNLIKVLAIQMRFRYLILSMCDVTA